MPNYAHTLNVLNCSDICYVNVCIFKYYSAFEVVKVLLKYEKNYKSKKRYKINVFIRKAKFPITRLPHSLISVAL